MRVVNQVVRLSALVGLGLGLGLGGSVPTAEAGGPWFRRPARTVVAPRAYAPSSYPASTGTAPTPMLGSFYPGPYMVARGNAPAGGGYSPMGLYGDTSLAVYGPISAMRAVAAPVHSYSRGYDGRVYATESTAFSYPMLPGTGPVIYPTQATNAFGLRQSGTPPWWKDASNWIDQN